ncbi:MAG: universal stress protein [Betaproteobacteria bacterium]
MDDIKRILVVSRMTTYCRKAVHYGISLAKKYGAELYFIHCTHDPFVFEWPPSLPVWVLAEDYKKLLIKNKEDIDTVINVEKEKGMKITELIKDVDPVEVILEAVKDEHIDLIIMAAHEEGRLEHLLFGHGYDEIIRKMPCSILLVKAEQEPV